VTITGWQASMEASCEGGKAVGEGCDRQVACRAGGPQVPSLPDPGSTGEMEDDGWGIEDLQEGADRGEREKLVRPVDKGDGIEYLPGPPKSP
jgi:hypothetical protein